MQNRRHFPRLSTRLPVKYRLVPHTGKKPISRSVDGIIRDLSLVGLSLETRHFTVDGLDLFGKEGSEESSRIHLDLEFSPEETIELMGEPVWYQTIPSENPLFIVGLRFKGVSQDDLRMLREYLTRLDKPLPPTEEAVKVTTVSAWISGLSNGNPGPAGIGVVLADERGEVLNEISEFIGKTTSANADYQALIAAMTEAQRMMVKRIILLTDSSLVRCVIEPDDRAKQTRHLQPLIHMTRILMQRFENVELISVQKDNNLPAERLARKAILNSRDSERRDRAADSEGS